MTAFLLLAAAPFALGLVAHWSRLWRYVAVLSALMLVVFNVFLGLGGLAALGEEDKSLAWFGVALPVLAFGMGFGLSFGLERWSSRRRDPPNVGWRDPK